MSDLPIAELREGLVRGTPEQIRDAAKRVADSRVTGLEWELVDRLKYENQLARIWCVYALGKVGGRKVVPYVAKLREDPHPDVRSFAAQALGLLGGDEALAALVTMSERTAEDDRVQRPVIAGLSRFASSGVAAQAVRAVAENPDVSAAIQTEARSYLPKFRPDVRPPEATVDQNCLFWEPSELRPENLTKPLAPPDAVPRRVRVTEVPVRNREIADRAKASRGHRCQLCAREGFRTKMNRLYSQAHHIVPLGQDGADTEDNLLVVCPTCHCKLHFAVVEAEFSQDGRRPERVFVNGEPSDVTW